MRTATAIVVLTACGVISAQELPGAVPPKVAAAVYNSATGDFFVSVNDANMLLQVTDGTSRFRVDAISPPKDDWFMSISFRNLVLATKGNEVNWYFGNIGEGLGFDGLLFASRHNISPSLFFRCNENPQVFRCVPEPSCSILAASAFLLIVRRRTRCCRVPPT